ncbi:MAG: molybdopterin converting factor subunit 1 [Acetobacteraceae bacterium]|nr:molybdopterin converting factor subunit 1 [Acetobacteraceae bacterium]
MRVLYFAWVREKVGRAEEELSLPSGVGTISQLVDHLAGLTPGHAAAFANRATIRAAVNQDFATPDAAVTDRDEVAFFPPVTGG